MSDPCSLCAVCAERIAALDRLTQESVKRLEQRIDALDRRVTEAFRSSDLALSKAEAALRDYKEASNEIRGALSDQRKDTMSRTEVESRFTAQEKDIAPLREYRGEGIGRSRGLEPLVQIGMIVLTAIVAVVVTLIFKR